MRNISFVNGRMCLSLALCLGLGLTACGEDGAEPADLSDAGSLDVQRDSPDAGPDTAPDANSPDTGMQPGFPCPNAPPVVGQACQPDGTLCGYDPASLDEIHTTSAEPSCRDLYECVGGSWEKRDKDISCAAEADPACPEALPTDGSSCSQTELACRYGAAICYCMSCTPQDPDGSDTEPTWRCTEPQDPLCPQLLPGDGEACDLPEEHVCFGYDRCFICGPWGSAAVPRCVDGKWDALYHSDCQA